MTVTEVKFAVSCFDNFSEYTSSGDLDLRLETVVSLEQLDKSICEQEPLVVSQLTPVETFCLRPSEHRNDNLTVGHASLSQGLMFASMVEILHLVVRIQMLLFMGGTQAGKGFGLEPILEEDP